MAKLLVGHFYLVDGRVGIYQFGAFGMYCFADPVTDEAFVIDDLEAMYVQEY
jgi:hypothetical protein